MKPIDYIYENIDCFNLAIFKQILEESGETVSEEIYDYLMETTWNTNPALLKQYGLDIERSNEKEDKNHTPIDLGTLFYQGGLQEGNINEDEGAMVQDIDEWYHAIESYHMYMVIENNIVLGTKTDEESISFVFNNSTVSITITTDDQTGDSVAVISGDVPSYYKIYAKQVE